MFRERQFVFTSAWKISKLYEKSMKSIHSKYKLTQCEMDIILFLETNKPLNTSRDISMHRSISKSLICKSVSLLCQKGLITAVGDEIDARVMRLKLTKQGEEIALQLLQVCDNLCEEMFKDLSNTETKLLENILTRMTNNCDKKRRMF